MLNELGFSSADPLAREKYHRRATELLEPLVESRSGPQTLRNLSVPSALANSYRPLGVAMLAQRRLDEAEQALRKAIAQCRNDTGWGQDVLASSPFADLFHEPVRPDDRSGCFARWLFAR